MVGKVDYSSVPTSVDLENNSNQKKYTVNQTSNKGFFITKPLCALMAIGALLLAVLVGLIVFFTIPRVCDGSKHAEPLTKSHQKLECGRNNAIVDKFKGDNGTVDIESDKAEEEIDERLPRNIEPLHYRVRILPDFENFTTSGSVTMILRVLEDTDTIVFHLHNISIPEHSVSVRSAETDSSLLAISNQEYVKGDKYAIQLKDKLRKNEEYQLYLDFNGFLNKHLKGFYGSYYYEGGRQRVIASTQFSPTDARRAFPCYDEPSFKATFSIVLGRPAHMNTLSNMPLFNTTAFTRNSEVWYWDEYPPTPKMSTYLVAFVVSELKKAETKDPIMTFWAREKFIDQTAFAAGIGPNILKYFEEYFEIKFPLQKIDIVALPSFGFNAMENWGLITFRESALLYDPTSSTTKDIRFIATVLAHEIAHQWFGNLVTPKYWNDLWLKEGFANYLSFLGINHVQPQWKFEDEFIIDVSQPALLSDAFESSRPISFDQAKNTNQIRQLFDSISYSKGAAIIKMMNHFLGESNFKEGLINFLKKYQFANADRQDLFKSLTEVAHKNGALNLNESLKIIMDTWSERAGYPVITAIADYEQQRLTINQKRFYFLPKEEKSSWWVPLSFTSNSTDGTPNFNDTSPKFWLRGEFEIEEDVNLTYNDWYLLNLDRTGYFIVNYDERNWEKLSESIMNLPPLIRAQLIGDSMDLARANLLNYDIPLKMLSNMAIQDSMIMLVPTLVAFEKLNFLSTILSNKPAFGLFEEFHRNIFQETYRKVILEDKIDDYITRRIRIAVLEWSCRSPDSRCTHMAKTSFRDWIIKGKRVEHNLRSIVYCTAIREGSEIEWDFAYRKFIDAVSPTEQNTILDALGCTRLKWLLSRYLDKILNDNSVQIQDADRIFKSVVENRFGTQIAFDFLRRNWDEIIKHHGDGFNIVSRMVISLGNQLNTEFELSELIRFRDSIKTNLGSTSRAFDTAIDTVKANVEWMKKNYKQVEQWLQNNKDMRTKIIEKLKAEEYIRSLSP